MVPLDSKFPKDSNEVSFAIFRVIDQKIWIMQVADDLKLIWT
jgi:hypothetical protein